MPLKADAVTKDYISDAEIFSDIFNYFIYGGRQVIRPEQLSERDPTEMALPYGADGAAVPVQKYRDAQKLFAAMTDGKTEYVLYGVEAQARVHYAMPVKNGLYDMLEYAGQVEEAAKSHRREMKRNGGEQAKAKNPDSGKQNENTASSLIIAKRSPSSGEFLGGFWRDDRLIPSVTLTLHLEPEVWDGPLSLFDMMETPEPEVLACMDNYHVRLLSPALMDDSEIMKFHTSLREVLLFIKYSKDKENLKRVLQADGNRFRNLERRAADVIEAVTNVGMKFEESEVEIDMCQAVKEMVDDGIKIGVEKGELSKARETARNLYEMGDGIEKISRCVGYAVETVRQWLGISNG